VEESKPRDGKASQEMEKKRAGLVAILEALDPARPGKCLFVTGTMSFCNLQHQYVNADVFQDCWALVTSHKPSLSCTTPPLNKTPV
jgi:hypothetical protein